MRPFASILAALRSSDVWAVYGIGGKERRSCLDCSYNGDLDGRTANETAYTSTNTFVPHATVVPTRFASTLERIPASTVASIVDATTPAPTAPEVQPTVDLDTGVKIGIGIAAGVLFVALLIVAIEACYLRKKRKERALQRAVEEVERGVDKGSEERIVLESRVSIIFEDDDQEHDEDEAEVERGRNGMSLPRRD